MDQAVANAVLIMAIGLGLPSFLVLVEGQAPRTTIPFAGATIGTTAAFAGMGMAFQNYGFLQALLSVLVGVTIGVAMMWLMPRMRDMPIMPIVSLALLLSYHSAL